MSDLSIRTLTDGLTQNVHERLAIELEIQEALNNAPEGSLRKNAQGLGELLNINTTTESIDKEFERVNKWFSAGHSRRYMDMLEKLEANLHARDALVDQHIEANVINEASEATRLYHQTLQSIQAAHSDGVNALSEFTKILEESRGRIIQAGKNIIDTHVKLTELLGLERAKDIVESIKAGRDITDSSALEGNADVMHHVNALKDSDAELKRLTKLQISTEALTEKRLLDFQKPQLEKLVEETKAIMSEAVGSHREAALLRLADAEKIFQESAAKAARATADAAHLETLTGEKGARLTRLFDAKQALHAGDEMFDATLNIARGTKGLPKGLKEALGHDIHDVAGAEEMIGALETAITHKKPKNNAALVALKDALTARIPLLEEAHAATAAAAELAEHSLITQDHIGRIGDLAKEHAARTPEQLAELKAHITSIAEGETVETLNAKVAETVESWAPPTPPEPRPAPIPRPTGGGEPEPKRGGRKWLPDWSWGKKAEATAEAAEHGGKFGAIGVVIASVCAGLGIGALNAEAQSRSHADRIGAGMADSMGRGY